MTNQIRLDSTRARSASLALVFLVKEVGRMRRRSFALAMSLCCAALMMVALLSPAASGATRSASTLPEGFRAQSLTWISSAQGWILGVAPCARGMCTTVLGTTDGGATWNPLGTLDAPLSTDVKS